MCYCTTATANSTTTNKSNKKQKKLQQQRHQQRWESFSFRRNSSFFIVPGIILENRLNLERKCVCVSLISSHLSRSLSDCWGTTVDFTNSFLHSLLFSAFRRMIFHLRLVHALVLSSHRFLSLPLRLPP